VAFFKLTDFNLLLILQLLLLLLLLLLPLLALLDSFIRETRAPYLLNVWHWWALSEYTHMHAYILMHAHTYSCTHLLIYLIHSHLHTYKCTYTHTHARTYLEEYLITFTYMLNTHKCMRTHNRTHFVYTFLYTQLLLPLLLPPSNGNASANLTLSDRWSLFWAFDDCTKGVWG